MAKKHVHILIDYPNILAMRLNKEMDWKILTADYICDVIATRLRILFAQTNDERISQSGIIFTDIERLWGNDGGAYRLGSAWSLHDINMFPCPRSGGGETIDEHLQRSIYRIIHEADDPRNIHFVFVLGDHGHSVAISWAIQQGASASMLLTSDTLIYHQMEADGMLEDVFPLYETEVAIVQDPKRDALLRRMENGRNARVTKMTEDHALQLFLVQSAPCQCDTCGQIMPAREWEKHPHNPYALNEIPMVTTEQDRLALSAFLAECDSSRFIRFVATNIQHAARGTLVHEAIASLSLINAQVTQTALLLNHIASEHRSQRIHVKDIMTLMGKFPLVQFDDLKRTGLIQDQNGPWVHMPEVVCLGIQPYIQEVLRRTGTEHTNALLQVNGLASDASLRHTVTDIVARAETTIDAIRQRALIVLARYHAGEIDTTAMSFQSLFYLLAAPDIEDIRDWVSEKEDIPSLETATWLGIMQKDPHLVLDMEDEDRVPIRERSIKSLTESTCLAVLHCVYRFTDTEGLLDGIETIARQCTNNPDVDGETLLTILIGCGLLRLGQEGGKIVLHRAAWTHPVFLMFQPRPGLRKCVNE